MGSSPLARGKLSALAELGSAFRIIPACAGETATTLTGRETHPDHPRLRGGNSGRSKRSRPGVGSSPLARGKLTGLLSHHRPQGIIPACAGETDHCHPGSSPSRDHPRLRGGNLAYQWGTSSGGRIIPACAGETRWSVRRAPWPRDHPRLRGGNVGRAPHRRRRGRIIPACAGETCGGCSRSPGGRDHPRLRGGNYTMEQSRFLLWGSSPLARGKQHPGRPDGRRQRIIPACAGETATHGDDLCLSADHPRLRGGNPKTGVSTYADGGSSPLARGKLRCHRPGGRHSWIIPACAGETRFVAKAFRNEGDHPRLRGGNKMNEIMPYYNKGSSPLARGKLDEGNKTISEFGIIPACAGETGARHNTVKYSTGSSPLARGKLGVCGKLTIQGRIIPACAGETLSTLFVLRRRGDHPRLRGGNISTLANSFHRGGSSPLARGKHRRESTAPNGKRIIPACAGETTDCRHYNSCSQDHPRLRGGNVRLWGVGGCMTGSSPLARGKLRLLRGL